MVGYNCEDYGACLKCLNKHEFHSVGDEKLCFVEKGIVVTIIRKVERRK